MENTRGGMVMVVFNIHFGQMRIRSGQPVFLPKSPRSKLIMQNYDSGIAGDKREYVANQLGNIEVADPRHIETMVGLGYPIYNGDGLSYPVPPDDLLYPNVHPESEYWRRINQALNKTWR